MSRRSDRRLIIGVTAAVLVAAAGSTVGLAAAAGAFAARPVTSVPGSADTGSTSGCPVPALPGSVVAVTLTDMGAGMHAPMMGAPMRSGRGGMMGVLVTPATVAAGTVSLRVHNRGVMTHELVVLPLPDAKPVGQREVGGDGRVDESGSLGEVSRSCGAGAGDGLTGGAIGWTSLHLPAGRYELVCNLPHHYAAGMYALLTVG